MLQKLDNKENSFARVAKREYKIHGLVRNGSLIMAFKSVDNSLK